MSEQRNNCDGCQAGYPVDENGIHYIPSEEGNSPWSRYRQMCTESLYCKDKEE